jgi:hypothetical protein
VLALGLTDGRSKCRHVRRTWLLLRCCITPSATSHHQQEEESARGLLRDRLRLRLRLRLRPEAPARPVTSRVATSAAYDAIAAGGSVGTKREGRSGVRARRRRSEISCDTCSGFGSRAREYPPDQLRALRRCSAVRARRAAMRSATRSRIAAANGMRYVGISVQNANTNHLRLEFEPQEHQNLLVFRFHQ